MTGARNASFDTPACTARGIRVCKHPGRWYPDSATAELALGLLICAASVSMGDERSGPKGSKAVFRSASGSPARPSGSSGPAGWAVIWQNTLGAADERDRLEPEPDAGTCSRGRGGAGLEGRADVDFDAISIDMVLSGRSRGLIGQDDIARMKPGAILMTRRVGRLSMKRRCWRRCRQAALSRRSMFTTGNHCRWIRCAVRPIRC